MRRTGEWLLILLHPSSLHFSPTQWRQIEEPTRATTGPHAAVDRSSPINPMNDFANCISDAIESIINSLCALELENHHPLYDWCLHRPLAFRPCPRASAAGHRLQWEQSSRCPRLRGSVAQGFYLYRCRVADEALTLREVPTVVRLKVKRRTTMSD